jgi:hypothetical protein
MFSAALDTVIGVAFTFFLLSTACSAVTEGIATLLRKRGDYLYRGLRQLLDGTSTGSEAGPAHWMRASMPGAIQRLRSFVGRILPDQMQKWVVGMRSTVRTVFRRPEHPAKPAGPAEPTAFDKVVEHPMVASQHRIRRAGVGRPPSYLSAATVATAVLDEVVPAAAGRQNPAELIASIYGTYGLRPHLQRSLLALAATAENGTPDFLKAIERWYDDHMARISGQYKRWTKKWLLVVAAVVVLVMHVDAVALTSVLWTSPSIRSAAVALASPGACDASGPTTAPGVKGQNSAIDYAKCLRDQAGALTAVGAPVGSLLPGCFDGGIWACVVPADPEPDPFPVIAGLVLSILAASFGAPFWFDVLTKAGSLRNAGAKPVPPK